MIRRTGWFFEMLNLVGGDAQLGVKIVFQNHPVKRTPDRNSSVFNKKDRKTACHCDVQKIHKR